MYMLDLSGNQSNIGYKHLWCQSLSVDSAHSGQHPDRPTGPGTWHPRWSLQQNEHYQAGYFNLVGVKNKTQLLPTSKRPWNPSLDSLASCVLPAWHFLDSWFPCPPMWLQTLLWAGLSPGPQLTFILNCICAPDIPWRTFTGSLCVDL